MERRRDRNNDRSPMEQLRELPALVVLERMLVPALAVGVDGTILFANQAFAEMLGSTADAIRSLNFREIFHTLPADGSAVSVVRDHAGLVVELKHQDNSIIRAWMSKSVLLRGDDAAALAMFQDMTERLWVEER